MKENKINTINCEDTFGSMKELGMEVQQLFETLESQLKSHDWFYEYSNDQRHYNTGRREFTQIWSTMDALKAIGENEFDHAINLFREHKPVVSTPNERVITN